MFSGHGRWRVTETDESKTVDKGLLYFSSLEPLFLLDNIFFFKKNWYCFQSTIFLQSGSTEARIQKLY